VLPLLVLLPWVPLAAASAPRWYPLDDKDGVRLEGREVPGSSHEELRALTKTQANAERVCDAVWGKGVPLDAGFRKREVLRENDSERLTYEQVATPVVSDRDYTLHVQREPRPEGGCLIVFQTRNELGPAPQRGLVRIPVIRGRWEIRPLDEGRSTEVLYLVYSEPGGGIPAIFSRGPSRTRTLEWLKVILARSARPAPSPARAEQTP
jgi:hypothetical protein